MRFSRIASSGAGLWASRASIALSTLVSMRLTKKLATPCVLPMSPPAAFSCSSPAMCA